MSFITNQQDKYDFSYLCLKPNFMLCPVAHRTRWSTVQAAFPGDIIVRIHYLEGKYYPVEYCIETEGKEHIFIGLENNPELIQALKSRYSDCFLHNFAREGLPLTLSPYEKDIAYKKTSSKVKNFFSKFGITANEHEFMQHFYPLSTRELEKSLEPMKWASRFKDMPTTHEEIMGKDLLMNNTKLVDWYGLEAFSGKAQKLDFTPHYHVHETFGHVSKIKGSTGISDAERYNAFIRVQRLKMIRDGKEIFLGEEISYLYL